MTCIVIGKVGHPPLVFEYGGFSVIYLQNEYKYKKKLVLMKNRVLPQKGRHV